MSSTQLVKYSFVFAFSLRPLCVADTRGTVEQIRVIQELKGLAVEPQQHSEPEIALDG